MADAGELPLRWVPARRGAARSIAGPCAGCRGGAESAAALSVRHSNAPCQAAAAAAAAGPPSPFLTPRPC
jgi:hypothetical protein